MKLNRREFAQTTAFGLAAATSTTVVAQVPPAARPPARSRVITLDAKPEPITIDVAKTAVIVIDMQNDFGTKGGMFDLGGIDISQIQAAVGPTSQVTSSARRNGINSVYLKMAFRPDLSDLGSSDSKNRLNHMRLNVGKVVRAPDGRESRILIRDTWNTDIVKELTPHADDVVVYKHRLPPPLTGFNRVQLPQDRLRVVLMHPNVGHGPGRPQSDGRVCRLAEQVGERLNGAHREGRDPADGRLEGGVAGRLELGLERGVLGQPAAQRGLPHGDAGRGLPDRRLGQQRQNGLLAHGRGFGAVADSGFRSSALVCARLGGVFTAIQAGVSHDLCGQDAPETGHAGVTGRAERRSARRPAPGGTELRVTIAAPTATSGLGEPSSHHY